MEVIKKQVCETSYRCKLTSGRGILIGMVIGGIIGLVCGPIGIIMGAILGAILGDSVEQYHIDSK